MKTLNSLFTFAFVLTLTACGGGRFDTPGIGESKEPSFVPEMAFLHKIEGSDIPGVGNPTLDRIEQYLSATSWEAEGYGHSRMRRIPTVRISEAASEQEVELVHHAVALINRELPHHSHLRIGSRVSHNVDVDDIPDENIYINFTTRIEGRHAGVATSQSISDDKVEGIFEPTRYIRAAQVDVLPFETQGGDPYSRTLHTLLHELLHALHVSGHPPLQQFPDSIMAATDGVYSDAGRHRDFSRLPKIDAGALRAALNIRPGNKDYTDFENNAEWDDDSYNLFLEFDMMSLGVEHINDVAVPWTRGIRPSAPPSYTGTMTYEGDLIGLTPAVDTVLGDTRIDVDMRDLTGEAEFTNLEVWMRETDDAPPQSEQWNEGELAYDLKIYRNFIRSIGGDEGTVIGEFYGSAHQGVAGSVERADLTAAFGAVQNGQPEGQQSH